MTVNYTTLLGLAKPVSGTESGTWGDTVNTNLTDYLDSAVAGAQIISGSLTAVTLSKTTGASLSQAGTGSTGSSQYQIIRCTGNPASLLTITAPAADKTYVVINATSTSQSVKIVGAGPTTGITILSGKTSLVAWNGSDFVEVSPNTISGVLPIANGGTNSTATPTAGGVGYGTGTAHAYTAAGTSGQVLTSAGASAPTWSTPAAATKTISNKTAAYTVIAGDLGKIINCTSGTFTVSLTAAATLGSGFTCTIWNTGTGAITIDPNAAETIDGVATLILRRGEGLAVVCNGTNWETDDKKPMRGYAENIISTTNRPIVTGTGAIIVGTSGNGCTGTNGMVVGYAADCSGIEAWSGGSRANAQSDYSVALGENSAQQGSVTATGAGAMALGGSYASGVDSFAAAIANNTSSYGATGANSVAIGWLSKASGGAYGSTALGYNSTATGWGSVAIARGTASGDFSISIGYNSSATAAYSVAIGDNSAGSASQAVTGAGAMALGGSYASGTDSFAAAIANNTSSYGAQGANSIAIGYQAKSTGNSHGMAMGAYAIAGDTGFATAYGDASGYGSFSMGYQTTASANYSVAIGSTNTAAGTYSFAAGHQSRSNQIGKYSFSSSSFGTRGTAQSGKIVLRAETTTTTAVVLTSDGAAASTNNQLIVDYDQAMAIQGTLIAKASGTGAMAGWNITGIVLNNGGTMVVSGLALTAIGSDSITLGAQPTIAVDNTNLGVKITSGYKSATSIRWCATVNTSEVVYA